jgi:hypothetical protein
VSAAATAREHEIARIESARVANSVRAKRSASCELRNNFAKRFRWCVRSLEKVA